MDRIESTAASNVCNIYIVANARSVSLSLFIFIFKCV